MSWIEKVTFDSKQDPLTDAEIEAAKGFLAKPLSEQEIEALEELCRVTGEVDFRSWELPDYSLPNEYLDLLKYSRNGLLFNGKRATWDVFTAI